MGERILLITAQVLELMGISPRERHLLKRALTPGEHESPDGGRYVMYDDAIPEDAVLGEPECIDEDPIEREVWQYSVVSDTFREDGSESLFLQPVAVRTRERPPERGSDGGRSQ